jgi:hypothetical protein
VSATPAADDLWVTAEGYERLYSQLESLRNDGHSATFETSELFEYDVVGAIEGNVGQGRISVEARSGARFSAPPRATSSRSPVHAESSASR